MVSGLKVRQLKTWQFTTGAAVAGLALAVTAVAAAGPWDATGQRTAEARRAAAQERTGGADHGGTGPGDPRAAASAPAVLAALGKAAESDARTDTADAEGGAPPAPTERALREALEPLLDSAELGPDPSASVVDAATGREVYGKGAGDAMTPASTTKIATAAAALSALGPEYRIRTTVVAEPGSDRIVLVGGGDPTLTAHKDTKGFAGLRDLADDTARALKSRGTKKVSLAYDTSAYTGPELHPIGPNDNIAPVVALMADEGRLDDSARGPAPRSTDPAADAAEAFAGMLKDRGVDVRKKPVHKDAPGKAQELAAARSAPLSALVERMLTNSDNDIAEALARQTALAGGEPADFDGAGRAMKAELKKLGLPLKKSSFADGSGLSRDDKLSAGLLTGLLALAANEDRPELRPVLTGLSVAGFTGTLKNRYAGEDNKAAAQGIGLVRAKTGTLTGVNTLAGSVVDADGRLLVFAFLAKDTGDPKAAQGTLDRLAAAVANCGCR